MNRPRLQGYLSSIDALRGLAIVAVVGLHVTGGYAIYTPAGSWQSLVAATLHLAAGFGVPMFVALSAFLLAQRYAVPMGLAGYRRFLRRRAGLLLPAYGIWSLLSFVVVRHGSLTSPMSLISTLVAGTADWQLYFIPLLFELYLAWPALRLVVDLCRATVAGTFAVLAGGVGLQLWGWQLSASGVLPAAPPALLLWATYVALGVAAAVHERSLRRWADNPRIRRASWAAVVVTLVVAVMHWHSVVTPALGPHARGIVLTIHQPAPMVYASAVIAAAFLVAARIPDRGIWSALGFVGRHAYGVFLTHMLMLRLIIHPLIADPYSAGSAQAADSGFWTSSALLPGLLASWLGCTVLALGVVVVAARLPLIAWSVSNRRTAAR